MTPSAQATVLTASKVGVCVGSHPLLQQADLSLNAGQWLCVCGPNGAGKSTLLRALAGLQDHSGQIELLGRPLQTWPATQRATRLTWVGQSQPVPMDLTVADVVQLGRWPLQQAHGADTAGHRLAVTDALRTMALTGLSGRPLQQLSGGECQRALLARAMAAATPVMLWDEPLNHLDLPHQQACLGWLRRHVSAGAAAVTVMHDLNQALAADQLLVMKGGRVLHQGSPADAATREALQEAFGHSIAFHAIDTHETAPRWVVLPRPIS